MKGKRHTPEQIVEKLRTAGEEQARGTSIEEACRVATYHRWNKECSGAKTETVKRLKELEKENARLKKLVAEQALDMDMLKEINRGKWQARSAAVKPSGTCAGSSRWANAGPAG
jgi:hypothetical protein